MRRRGRLGPEQEKRTLRSAKSQVGWLIERFAGLGPEEPDVEDYVPGMVCTACAGMASDRSEVDSGAVRKFRGRVTAATRTRLSGKR